MANKEVSPLASIIGIVLASLLIIGIWSTTAIAIGFFGGLIVSAYRIVTGDM